MEEWKPSPLGPDHVRVSNLGRVRTLDREAPSKREHQPTQMRAGKLLSPWLSFCGYPIVSVKVGDKRPKFAVHRLVASAFCEGYAPGLCVNHIDGDKLNNDYRNLEWVSLETNSSLAWATGLNKAVSRAKKLTADDVAAIRLALGAGQSGNSLSVAYNVSPRMIYLIRDGLRWVSPY